MDFYSSGSLVSTFHRLQVPDETWCRGLVLFSTPQTLQLLLHIRPTTAISTSQGGETKRERRIRVLGLRGGVPPLLMTSRGGVKESHCGEIVYWPSCRSQWCINGKKSIVAARHLFQLFCMYCMLYIVHTEQVESMVARRYSEFWLWIWGSKFQSEAP